MKIGKSSDITNLFNKVTDDSDDITEGATKKFDTGVPPVDTDELTEGAVNKYDTGAPPATTDELTEGAANFYAGVSGADFKKAVDTSDDITEGTTKLFYLDADKTKVGYLPAGANAYLEIPEFATEPAVAGEGEMYRNTATDKFFMVKSAAWVEVLFSMEEVV